MFDSIVNDDVQYPECIPPGAVSIIQKASVPLLLPTREFRQKQRIQWKMAAHINEPQMCLQLLKKNPLKRLGAGERDANEVKGDKFFEVKTLFHQLPLNKYNTSVLEWQIFAYS